MRSRVIKRCMFVSATLFAVLAQGVAEAQVNITPNFSLTPSKTVTPWVYQMAIATVIIGALVLLGLGASYLRFAPRFFGRQEAPAKPPPGTRPAFATQAQNVPRTPAGSTRPEVPASGGGVAVVERPATAPPATPEAPAAEPPAAEASPEPTAGAMSEPAVQADAVGEAEAAAPETGPSAKAPEEGGEAPETAATQEQPTQVETPSGVEQAEPQVAPAEEPAQPAAAVQPSGGGHAVMDQETFDRVLEEQLAKGIDRRVAEGRARAAAVVAARKKAQG